MRSLISAALAVTGCALLAIAFGAVVAPKKMRNPNTSRDPKRNRTPGKKLIPASVVSVDDFYETMLHRLHSNENN